MRAAPKALKRFVPRRSALTLERRCIATYANRSLARADEQSDDDNSEASAESVGGTIDWDIPLKLPRSVLMAAQQAREAEAAASAAVRPGSCLTSDLAVAAAVCVQV